MTALKQIFFFPHTAAPRVLLLIIALVGAAAPINYWKSSFLSDIARRNGGRANEAVSIHSQTELERSFNIGSLDDN